MKLAILPARGGSKRIPRKNIKLFLGQPMISWPIRAAQESGCFDRIIVSTDDEEIAQTAVRFGAEAPFTRPAELSDDFVGITQVVSHAIRAIDPSGSCFENICCILPTAPFLKAQDLYRGLSLLTQEDVDFVVSVTSFSSPIQRALRVTKNGKLEMFDPKLFKVRSQDLEPAWHDAGQFYWGKAQAWVSERPIFGDRTVPVYLPRQRVQDIDTLEDWACAEYAFRVLKEADRGDG